jgi:hypothetical protein
MHSPRPEAPVWAKVWPALAIFSVISCVLRFLYYRNRRNYFAEEMDHRHTLAKESIRAES